MYMYSFLLAGEPQVLRKPGLQVHKTINSLRLLLFYLFAVRGGGGGGGMVPLLPTYDT